MPSRTLGRTSPAFRTRSFELEIMRRCAVLPWDVLKTGTPYTEPGADFYTRRESPEQRHAYLDRQLASLHPGIGLM